MLHSKRRFLSLFAVFLVLLVGCSSSTKLIKRWHDPDYTGPKLQKVLVLGLFKDEAQRRAFETAFVKQIDPSGKQAVAGYTLMPEMEDFDSKEKIMAAVEQTGADSVMITHFKGDIKKAREVPGRVEYIPDAGSRYGYGGNRYGRYGSGYGGYYGSTYQTVYRDGYTAMDSIVQLDTKVYSVATEKPVWSGFSKSLNPKSGEKIIKELVKLITTDMRKSGLIN
jgi:hypothetical protein